MAVALFCELKLLGGKVIIDGTDARSLELISLRGRLSIIQQERTTTRYTLLAYTYYLRLTPHQSPITDHQSPVTNRQSPITNHQSLFFAHTWHSSLLLATPYLLPT
jgi:hypothetical protein